jgi:hypothetical protein
VVDSDSDGDDDGKGGAKKEEKEGEKAGEEEASSQPAAGGHTGLRYCSIVYCTVHLALIGLFSLYNRSLFPLHVSL